MPQENQTTEGSAQPAPDRKKRSGRNDRGKKRRKYNRNYLATKDKAPPKLGIHWTDREREYAAQQLAEMFTVPEATDRILLNYQAEWKLQTKNADGTANVEGYNRFVEVRSWINGRVWSIKADPKMQRWRDLIELKRMEWLKNIKERFREANIAGRIEDYIRIKEAAMKAGQFNAAIRALLAISVEVGDLKSKNPLAGDNVNNFFGDMNMNIQWNNLTLDQVDRLRRGEHPYEVLPELKPKQKG